ncbi:MAG: phosphate ABC transporter permease subunit PstC [Bacterioplanes sp.]|nr:phosphate ABC transporter permease subunit PstC [Bacterioplanes sp.]
MSNLTLMIVLLAVLAITYQLGLVRTRQIAGHNATLRMHSRPHHYGVMVGLWTVLPAFFIFIIWSWSAPWALNQLLIAQLPEHIVNDPQELRVAIRRISNLAANFGIVSEAATWEIQAATFLSDARQLSQTLMLALMTTVAAAGALYGYRSISPLYRARNHIEKILQIVLVICSSIAVLTTLGIVLSMVGESLRFFSFVSPMDFFFGTTWNPRFSTAGVGEGSLTGDQGSFGMLPLLAGTFLIALVAMSVAIPLGLLAAIYLAEYASPKMRATAKPIIEMLAGIPTIVYGFFALVTVGPFLSMLGAHIGLDIRATSALTAGVVMGIMIIPFISSLSDDIITQVPKSLRDGSLGLGATKSETIRKVVLPAALPGIVGAILLGASRAIGETMIVVLAAGNSPSLTANPFEAVSTITVTIVNQLTGDNDFASPQSLVAFALGLTLFAITLILNVIALVIVRKYREQYE